jgi:sugar phosphate isomerase/epimerase
MRVAGHTYPYRDRPLEEALDELAGLQFSLVEVWLGHAVDGPDGVAHALRERGLEAAAVSAGGFYSPDSDAVPRTIELARALGAPVIVACVAPEVLDSVVERLPAEITLCVENHWDQSLATSRDVSGVLGTYPGIAACVDTGHAILAGEPPERFVASLGDRVRHVHLKDAASPPLRERLMGRRLRTRLLPRPAAVVPGDGDLDVGRVRRTLEDNGYAGAVSLEHEGAEPSAALELLLGKWMSSDRAAVARG